VLCEFTPFLGKPPNREQGSRGEQKTPRVDAAGGHTRESYTDALLKVGEGYTGLVDLAAEKYGIEFRRTGREYVLELLRRTAIPSV
jgi:hypothetical protein